MTTVSTATTEHCPVHEGAMTLHGGESRIDPEIFNNPYPFYRALREEKPIYFDEKLNMYLVTRYDDCERILKDDVNFSLEMAHAGNGEASFKREVDEILEKEGGGRFADLGIGSDPPAHKRVRRLMEKAFTAHRVRDLEERIRQIVVDLIEPLAEKGHGDGVQDIGIPLTASLICEQLGFDFSEIGPHRIAGWSAATLAQMGRLQSREEAEKHARTLCDMQLYVIKHVRARADEPREDMISDIVHARLDDDENPTLSFGEQMGAIKSLLIAGNDTTAAALANLMMALALQPELAEKLRESSGDDRLMTRFVEETLRIYTPVHGLWRSPRHDIEIGGVLLPKGAQVCIMFASANDDDAQFPCPRTIDLARPNITRHLTFGAGVHRCIGVALARMEIKVAAEEIVKRLDNIKLAIPVEQITYHHSLATHTVNRLPLTFTRRA